MAPRNLLDSKTKVSVSATAPGSSRKHLLSDSEEPWTAPSLPAHVHLSFPVPVRDATQIAITFQGGFVGTTASIYLAGRHSDRESIELGLVFAGKIYPEDKSKRQIFSIPLPPHLTPSSQTLEASPATEVSVNGSVTPLPQQPSNTEKGWTELTELKIEFESSSDNQGRITIYQLELLG